MKIEIKNCIDTSEWDRVVMETYGRPYCFQQQDGCKDRGTEEITVPNEAEDFEELQVPENVNHDEMGVSFAAWIERDPKKPLTGNNDSFSLQLWWERNFYPNIQMVANDLHSKGILPAGEYLIVIDW